METKTYTAFAGTTRVARGDLKTTLTAVWKQLRQAPEESLLIFDDLTGRQVDFDLSGSLEEVLAKAIPPADKKGPGRPRLGVVCGEVCLLPRHWEWLEGQPQSASATIRRLVDAARKNESPEDRARRIIDAVGKFMWSIAGDLPGFEEATRALYAGKWQVFDALVAPWPADIRNHVSAMLKDVRGAGGARPE